MMKNNRFKKTVLMAILVSGLAIQPAMASPEQERAYLLQLIRQLEAMQPTILAAEKEISKDARIQFHYRGYRDAEGHWHNGLQDDLKQIQAGIQEKLNAPSIEPRTVPPLSGDYLGVVVSEDKPS